MKLGKQRRENHLVRTSLIDCKISKNLSDSPGEKSELKKSSARAKESYRLAPAGRAD